MQCMQHVYDQIAQQLKSNKTKVVATYMHETCTVETGITAKKPGVLDLEKYGSCQAGVQDPESVNNQTHGPVTILL